MNSNYSFVIYAITIMRRFIIFSYQSYKMITLSWRFIAKKTINSTFYYITLLWFYYITLLWFYYITLLWFYYTSRYCDEINQFDVLLQKNNQFDVLLHITLSWFYYISRYCDEINQIDVLYILRHCDEINQFDVLLRITLSWYYIFVNDCWNVFLISSI